MCALIGIEEITLQRNTRPLFSAVSVSCEKLLFLIWGRFLNLENQHQTEDVVAMVDGLPRDRY
jgi:hypothetical protein